MVPIRTHSVRPTSPTTSCLSGRSEGPYRAWNAGSVFPVLFEPDADDASDVGVGLRQRHVGLQPGEPLETERRYRLRAVDPKRQDDVELTAESELRRHDADDLVRSTVDGERPVEDGSVTAKLPMPVGVAEHHGVRRPWSILCIREPSADLRLDAERGQDSPAHRQRAHFLWIPAAGDGRRRAIRAPRAQVLEGLAVLLLGDEDHVGEVRQVRAANRVGIRTSLSESGYGSGLMSTALTTLKIAVVAPMPSAIVTIAAAANPGCVRVTRAE